MLFHPESIGPVEAPAYVCALLEGLLTEVARVFGNREQHPWDCYEDPRIPGITFRGFYWGDDEAIAALPNLEAAGVSIRWYKHPGRSVTVDKERTPAEWCAWYEQVRETIRKAGPR